MKELARSVLRSDQLAWVYIGLREPIDSNEFAIGKIFLLSRWRVK